MPEPSILSPFGEGYCLYCRFIIGLDADGVMSLHSRGRNVDRYSAGYLAPCRGSGRRPAKRAPYSSRKSRFRLTPPAAVCPTCGNEVAVSQYGGSDTRYFLRHRAQYGNCVESGAPIPSGTPVR